MLRQISYISMDLISSVALLDAQLQYLVHPVYNALKNEKVGVISLASCQVNNFCQFAHRHCKIGPQTF